MRKYLITVAASVIALSIGGPALAAGLSGASTMRVQVDVYKGPVGQPIEAQLGELSALLAQAARAANTWNMEARFLADDAEDFGCARTRPTNSDCAILLQGLAASADLVDAICSLHGVPSRITDKDLFDREWRRSNWPDDSPEAKNRQKGAFESERAKGTMQSNRKDALENRPVLSQEIYRNDGAMIPVDGCDGDLHRTWGEFDRNGSREIGTLDPLPSLTDGTVRIGDTRLGSRPETGIIIRGQQDYVRRVATIASMMQIEAQRLASANLARVPKSRLVRTKMAELGFLLGEFAQRTSARNSVLAKLLEKCEGEGDCRQPSKLPTSAYLRDADPSKYIDVFQWFNAGMSSGGTGAYVRHNRIEAIKQLTEDQNWEQINDVYASGQGDVGMVFIKDDLGNWNLKSFSNDPTELLAAYRKGADAAISSAVKLAKKAANPALGAVDTVSQSQRLLDLADTFSGGTKDPDVVGGTSLSQLRNSTVQRLKSLKTRMDSQKKILENDINSKAPDNYDPKLPSIYNAAAAETKARSDRDIASAAVDQARQSLAGARSNMNGCESDCGDETAALEAAVRVEAKAVADLATAEADLRTATSLHDRRKAELEGLAVSAAEAASIILSDHETALAAIIQVSKPQAAPLSMDSALTQ